MHICRGFNEIIRSFTIENLLPITFATTGYIFSLTLVNGLMVPEANQSYIIFIQSLSAGTISFAFIVFSRVLFRLLSSRHSEKSAQKVIIFGVEDSAKELYTSLTYNKQKTIVGFISNDLNSIGRELFGKRIFSIKEARDIWKSNNKIQLYLASRSITEEEKGELINLCVSLGVKVKQISSYSDMLREKEINLTDLNISDLLPRSNIDQFTSDIKFLNNKNIVISGAGGSIGSEISRIIAKIAKPKKLILLDISEASLFAIAEEIKSMKTSIQIKNVILDVKDKAKIKILFKEIKPDIIYHAAAYKHVPLLEEKYNFAQSLENNFFGTANLANAAIENGVDKFILISTDKAVRPTNMMGASKRMAELYIQALDKEKNNTILTSVRFGNVIDSSGSVIPTFRRQIKNGGPVTVTHPDIIRYFMTIGEAAYLVILSSIIAESSGAYILKMGEPVKILDIAKRMIKLSGNDIKTDSRSGIEIIFSGLRPGEKLYEELLVDETNIETKHPKIFKDTTDQRISLEELNENITFMTKELHDGDFTKIKQRLIKYADYEPS